eukprot:TRINITY_DN1243_c1_g1_i1.p1 TRINITY_DN1243_c1_g1~~TRINITY_DN1243_c1_g1_i1.p1  ORF type:complete len:185 (+),score=21.27 TRINITY_DN1243_c1_g1_i1:101-655(+)
MEDPFDDIKDEVEEGVKRCEKLIRQNGFTTQEVAEIRVQIEGDLKVLGEAVRIIERMPARYGLTQCDVDERVLWMVGVQRRMEKINSLCIAPDEEDKENTDGPFIDDESADTDDADCYLRTHFETQHEKHMVQDANLRKLDAAMLRQKSIATEINIELTTQDNLLTSLEGKIDHATGQLMKLSV